MPTWLPFSDVPSWWLVALATVLTVATFLISLGVTAWALVQIPADYFKGDQAIAPWADRHPVARWALRVGKNLLGVLLVALGIVLSLPGVPGQGILTILLGLMLIDFPGRRRCEQWLVRRQRVRSAINRIRARFGKPALILDE